MTELEEKNKALIRQWHEEIDKGKLDNFWEMFHPDFLWYDPSNSPNPLSKEETCEFLAKAIKAFTRMTHKIEEIIAVNDKVIVRTVNCVTHAGEFQGIPVEGKEVEFSGINIFRIKEGKIVEAREEADKLSWFQQLGLVIKPND